MLVDGNGGKYVFADAIGVSYESVRKWCKGINLPDGNGMLAIRDKFGVSIDWLLSGEDPAPVKIPGKDDPGKPADADSMNGWPEEVKHACRQLKTILLSDHPVIKPALLSNLAAFQHSVEKEKSQDEEIEKLSKRLQDLEQRHKAKRRTGTDGAA